MQMSIVGNMFQKNAAWWGFTQRAEPFLARMDDTFLLSG
jgi:hypothetical protein